MTAQQSLPHDFVPTIHHDVYADIDPAGKLKGSYQGKTVMITGAGRGIGKALAVGFALAGASTMILTARSLPELEAVSLSIQTDSRISSRPKIIVQKVDVTSKESVSALFANLEEAEVEVDALINNAGYLEEFKKIHEQEPEDWWKTWEVNVLGTYIPTHLLLKSYMSDPAHASRGLTILNTSSVGSINCRPGASAYQPSKTAINRFTEFIDAEYRDEGVRAYAYHPGGVMTQLAGRMPKETHGLLGDTPELAAGWAVWLVSSAGGRGEGHESNVQGLKEVLARWRGKYLSCGWHVKELVALTRGELQGTGGGLDFAGGRWGEDKWGKTRPNW